MAGEPQNVQEQIELEERARRIMRAALNNKVLMAQVRESRRLAAEGSVPVSLAELEAK